ncbi:sulfite exporter TauE/SafE family protein [Phenylobacterium sp. LjRoot225]|uniref:sulfite exporter TauE/SafE family protein n=1 Tax=Phenylobacterium sp. LjRoot225 TaxID=3342285 RepID=UPI003ED01736
MTSASVEPRKRDLAAAFGGGGAIGALGGLIGLGGAEFRLPLLIGMFGFGPLEAVIMNKAMSLVVVASALPFRLMAVPLSELSAHWTVIANLLAGSLAGAWFGAGWATRLRSETLYRIIAVLLVAIAIVLLVGHDTTNTGGALLAGPLQIAVGVGAGFLIGVVASLLGVAGGELLIPTIVLLFGADIKLAGSLSLAVSLPTMIIGFTRYSRDSSFAVLGRNRLFLAVMAAGSIVGSSIGATLLGIVPNAVLLPVLAGVLLISSVKVWRHR